MVLIYTGKGKGKTTAALGQAVRVLGKSNTQVALFQFIKSEEWCAGEEKALVQFGDRVTIVKGGKGFVGILGDTLPREEHKKAAQGLLQTVQSTCAENTFKLVILDEINVALSLGLLEVQQVLAVLDALPETTDVILTGRAAPQELIDRADLVTEFVDKKHPYHNGIQGQRGREY